MCGIAGVMVWGRGGRSSDARAVGAMVECLAHRGPDGVGIWPSDDGRVCLGHRRLAIIDLVTGAQPMIDRETGIAITFNGEIYNYRELRSALEADGVRFRTDSDTEVMLKLYAARGDDFLDDLRGMFALAIWDPRNERMVLARDRMGKKPLLYWTDDDTIWFASTIAALRTVVPDARFDIEAIEQFIAQGYIMAPRTAFRSIRRLPAGCRAIADANGLRVEGYWNPQDSAEPFEGTHDEAVDCLDELIGESVRLRLRSDVPLGVFLSGGVDSSLVAAVAAKQTDGPIHTFSIGFDDSSFDERSFAAEVAGRIGSEHHAFRGHFDTLRLLPDIVRQFGEPFGDHSAIPTWLLAEETRKHVTVALGGDGGDEGFAGYDWYRTALRFARMDRAVPRGMARFGGSVLAGHRSGTGLASRISRGTVLLAFDDADRYAALRSFIDDTLADQLYAGELREAWSSGCATRTVVARRYDATTGSNLARMRIVDIEAYLADCLMPKVDVATMAHGLEARAPLLDHRIIEFGLGLPDQWLRQGNQGKRILLDVLGRYLPASLFQRRKQGFDMPLDSWFRSDLRATVEALPDAPALNDTGWFIPDGLRRLVSDHVNGRRNHGQRIYNFLVLREWLTQV